MVSQIILPGTRKLNSFLELLTLVSATLRTRRCRRTLTDVPCQTGTIIRHTLRRLSYFGRNLVCNANPETFHSEFTTL